MKRFVSVLLLAALLLSLCACHGNGVRKPEESAASPAEAAAPVSEADAAENNVSDAAESANAETVPEETEFSIGSLDPNKHYTITLGEERYQ